MMEKKIYHLIKLINEFKASRQKIISSVNSQNDKLASLIKKSQ